jgi:hypothetical protein
MKTKMIKKGLCIVALASITITASAQRLCHRYPHRTHVTVVSPSVIVKPTKVIKVTTTSKDRLAMAIAYLRENKYLMVSDYARMTGLTKNSAQAELNAFCARKHSPLLKIFEDGITRYTLA